MRAVCTPLTRKWPLVYLYTRRGEATGLWVVPSSAIIAVQPDEAAPFFDPSDDKIYRYPTFYEMPEGAKNI